MQQLFARVYLVVLAGVLLTACTSPASSPNSGTVRIRWARDPENLDPLIVSNASAYEVANLTHCSLLMGRESVHDFVPWLAEEFPTVQRPNDSLLLVTYRIRPEATWDNGSPVLAHDVALTLKVMNCPGLPIEKDQAVYGFIRDIQLDSADARRFTLVCQGQSPEHIRTSGDFSILPEYILDPKKQLRAVPLPAMLRAPILPAVQALAQRYQALQVARHPENVPGCGPYTVTAWQSNRYLTLSRKKRWWADALAPAPAQLQAYPTKLVYQVIPDAATATLALRRGDVDVFALMPAAEFARLQQSAEDQKRLNFYTADSYEFATASFNVQQPMFRDAATRRALGLLFDVPALIKATQQGGALPSAGLISPRIKPYYNDSLPLPTFAPKQAVTLLQQAGWQRGATGQWTRPSKTGAAELLRFGISYRAGEPTFETIALQFRAAAEKIGIVVELRPTEQSVLSRQLREGTAEMSIRNFSGNPFSYDFTSLLHSRGIGADNTTRFSTPLTDRLIEQITSTEDATRKTRLLRKFQRVMAQEVPFKVLYFLQYRIAAARSIGQVPVSGLKPGYEAARIRPVQTAQ
ncbi:ABC transporter substrate-binding protein [Hymenobacter endophyticus]|uniref:ABC transporter substrate-binding protein n=1 Tax=Hymenobacter endophyticus TaxID=3076335 RepID=A0ABU3TCY2_9BACT|nr:ABC transporter substrate-binding protein [Hymenobacter endophyticus]MDU0369223.1 ABC transporter substrate-binding protein [Hymenobacter endophyticus]